MAGWKHKNDLFVRSPDQCRRIRHPDRRLLRGDGLGRVAVVRHSRHRQYRPSGLYHSRLLRRLYAQPRLWHRSDHRQHHHAAGVLRTGRGHLPDLLRGVREARSGIAARARILLRPAVHHRSCAGAVFRRRLPRRGGVVYRPDLAPRRRRHTAAHRGAVPGFASPHRGAPASARPHLYRPRHHGGGAGPARAAPDGGEPDPHQTHRLCDFNRHRLARRRLSDHHPASRTVGRPRLYRPHLRHLRAGRHGQPAWDRDRLDADRRRREF